jgi:hypothetical protein
VSAVLGDPAARGKGNGESVLATSRHNGTFAMIGTLFLFAFWPSFNAALLTGAAQHRAVINTTLSICASVVTSFAFSRAIHGGTRFDMEHVQNACVVRRTRGLGTGHGGSYYGARGPPSRCLHLQITPLSPTLPSPQRPPSPTLTSPAARWRAAW